MLFNSIEFLLFLPLVFCGYWFIFRKLSCQNLFIVASSYLFYGWWDWRFLFLIFFTTVACYISGLLIYKSNNDKSKKWICGVNIGINIFILCFFKYFNFFSENFRLLFEQFGYQLDWFTLDVLLPVGISFYTFQAISYPIDVYRRNIKATRNFVAFTAFISFFPQLVAGPIERSTQLLPQFLTKRKFIYKEAVDGMRQILWGFFKKIVIADNCALLTNSIFNNYTAASSLTLCAGALFFTFQIYGDFSGYSDIAIGVAKLFGIHLSKNFHFPYFSKNVAEFWRRWHISLNTWFKDYIYIPLGGSRCKKWKIVRNTIIVFLLSGLWHGANWTFVVWGAYYSLLFIPHILWNKKKGDQEEIITLQKGLKWLKKFFSRILTFIIIVIGWIIFRSETIYSAYHYIWNLFSFSKKGLSIYAIDGINTTTVCATVLMIILLMLCEWSQRNKLFGLQIVEGKQRLVRWTSYLTLIFIIIIFAGVQEQFIYFQF